MSQDRSQKPVVLVTGAAGLIGTPLLRALAPRYDTVGFDIVEPKTSVAAADWIKCDLTEDDGVAAALAQFRDQHGGTLASVIHLAA